MIPLSRHQARPARSRFRSLWLIALILGGSLILLGVGVALLLLPEGLPSRALLTLQLNESLPETRSSGMVERLMGWEETTLLDVVRGLDAASRDQRIRAVSIQLPALDCGRR